MKSNMQMHGCGGELAIAATAVLIWSLLGLSLAVLNPPPSQGGAREGILEPITNTKAAAMESG